MNDFEKSHTKFDYGKQIYQLALQYNGYINYTH